MADKKLLLWPTDRKDFFLHFLIDKSAFMEFSYLNYNGVELKKS